MIEMVRVAPRCEVLLLDIFDSADGRRSGFRVRRVGSIIVDIEFMAFNYRVVFRDVTGPIGLDYTGHGWCYSKTEGLGAVIDYACEWELDDVSDLGSFPHPPGPWIKAVHSGVYREPGIGQTGPDGLRRGFGGRVMVDE